MAYDPNHEYRFTDENGNTFTSRGDNGYVWQAVTEGIPISVDANGNWYTEPYLDVEKDGYVAHIPNWFKDTKEYTDWQTYASQIPNLPVNKTVYENLNGILKTLGSQGALRHSLTQDIKVYGVTNQELIDKYVKDIVGMAAEGQGGDKAKITLFGTEYNSAADVARHYKDLNKESLSKAMTSMYDIMDKGSKGEWKDKEEYLADAVTTAKILNYIDDNHISYGDNDEFNGLLSSSVWQQINRGFTQFMGGVSSNTFVGIPARLAYASLNAQYGDGSFNMKIEDLYNERVATGADLGAGLEGNEAADVVGMWGGAIGSIAVTMATSMMMGSAINGKVATSAPGGFWNNVGTFAQTIPGAAVSDFFLNDVPLNLTMFATDAMRDGVSKAWYDPENPQPLFGIPFIRQGQDGNFYPSGFGPDVPGGLAMNLVGDAVLDAAVPFLGIVGNATYKTLDNMTGGGITRVREKAAVLNLRIQQKLTDIPVLGTGWQKFVNYMMGAENAQFMREARKAAIAEGSMEPYVRAQNLLTLANHSGMEVIQPMYKVLDSELKISETLKNFNKRANELGGVGETRVEWKEIVKGRTETKYKVVPDTIPKDVKQTLLDTERLSELRGEIQNEGGLIPNAARNREIAEIEARLEKAPQELKDFAVAFSELNKRVEAMSVALGITKQDWIDALALDPRWEKYMTRQALVPGQYGVASGANPPDAAILTAKRKGYYADNYIDPTLAIGMKVEALGRAFAWNERAKAMVGFEISQGKVIAGKAGVDVAARLAEVKQEIKTSVEYRKSIGYDDALNKVNRDVTSVSDAFKKVNDLLNLPEKLSLKSVYEATQNPAIKEFISDFNKGKIKFAEGVKEAAGLSDSDAASIIQNTYVQKGGEARAVSEAAETRAFDEELTDAVKIGDSTRKVSWTQEEWDAWNQIDRTLSNMEAFELSAKGSHAGILDLRKKLEEAARGQKYKGRPYVAALKQQAIDGLKELGVPTHLIEKIEVPHRLADANIPDTATSPVRTKLEEKAAAAGYSAGVTPDGTPYKYTVENGEITSFEKLDSNEDYAMATSMLGGVYSMSASTVDRIGKINAAAINRTILYYRDNMPNIGTGPTFFFDGSSGSWGYIWPATVTSQYGWHLEDGKIVAEQYPVYLGSSYRKGNEDAVLRKKQAESASGFKPKNTGTLESTPTHESGHSWMMQLAVHRLNRMAEEGVVKLPEDSYEIGRMVEDSYDDLHALLIDRAMKKLGYDKYSEADVTRMANTISEYAASTNYGLDNAGRWKHDEIFSEAQRMYQGNGVNSSPFCLAIIEEMKVESERFTTAAAPGEVFAKNNLTAPKGLFKDGQYAFPSKAKSAKQKAKWLDEFRQNNPYLKGKGLLTEENYQMANLWDTFFQKEIRAYDPNSKSAMPDLLAKKNGDFIEAFSKNAAKKMVEEIKKASVEGFSQELATMVLSRNSSDITSAMNEFIIGRVNKAAEEVAAKMPGGLTDGNLNTARMTMWSEDNIKNDFITMLSALSPDIDGKNIASKINELFDTQAKGYASFEALPVDTKELIGEQERLTEKLYKENNYALAKGKDVDKGLTEYRGDVTQVIHYKEGGEDVYVVVNDPVIAEVLKKPNNYQETGVVAESLANAANFISRAYRLGTTGANPIAFVRNILRDPMQAAIQGGFNPLRMSLSPEVFYTTLRNFGLDDSTIKTVTERLANWAGSSGMTAEMRNMGVTTPGSAGYRNRVEKVSKKLNKIGEKKIIERAEAPLETWETMFRNQIAQQSFVKNYERFKDVNRAMGTAMFDASNSTTNFSHSVGMFKRATSTVPYLSSAINGTRSFWVQFNVDPIGMMTRITAGFMVPAMAITAWNLSSQERREQYMNLPEWYKDGHLILIDLEGNAISFPIPGELSQYYGTARRLMEYTQEATPYAIGQIIAKGAFGFLPVDTDGYFSADGTIDFERGTAQMFSGLIPQAATAIYEFVKEKDLFTGADLSNYSAFQKWLNLGSNVLGTGFKTLVNDIGTVLGAPKDMMLGKNTADTLARDLFGVGFDNAKTEFMNLVGNPSEVDPETGKETEATGLFKENEKLQKEIENINAQIAYSSEDKKAELEKMKEDKIQAFTDRVTNLVNKYMNLYTQAGGIEEWQKEKLVKLLTLGRASSSGASGSYQSGDMSDAYLNERALAQQRYVQAGLPAGPSFEALGDNGSIELQAAINRFYGVNKQATQDFENAIKASGAKDVKEEFYSVINQIYDAAEEQGKSPDYDLIEKIQARYLQMMDAALIPLINQYGVNVLDNSDFIDAVRKQVSGMIPSDDWRQSTKNAKKFLSTKEFPTATVDVKKWLKQRYTSGMRNRNIDSDQEVTDRLDSIRADIDAGRMGSARGKIDDLKKGVNKANFYISSKDLMTLNELNNMVK